MQIKTPSLPFPQVSTLEPEVATKSDFAELRSDFAELRSDFSEQRAEMTAGFAGVNERFDRMYLTLVGGWFVIVAAMAGFVFTTF